MELLISPLPGPAVSNTFEAMVFFGSALIVLFIGFRVAAAVWDDVFYW